MPSAGRPPATPLGGALSDRTMADQWPEINDDNTVAAAAAVATTVAAKHSAITCSSQTGLRFSQRSRMDE